MKKLLILFFLILTCLMIGVYYYKYYDSASALSKYGSRGTEVTNIQTRLKSWGYYTGTVDGIYGWRTASAVRLFQSKNGLKVDGVAGPQTLAAIGLPTGTTATSNNSNLIARLVNAEARGEPYIGQVAVGAVILNRVEHPSFPNTVAGVIYQPGAFTAITDGQIHAAMVSSSYKAANDALNGWDPSYNAIYYYNPAKTTNKWIYSRQVTVTIGKHIFAK